MATDRFKSDGGLSLFYSVDFPAADRSESAIVIIHGLGDHSLSLPYQLLTDFLVDHGLPVFRYDLRGHGSSEGGRGHIDSFDQHRTDLAAAIGLARSITKCSRVYLIAASMGGLIAIGHALVDPAVVAGVVAIAPALSLSGSSILVRTLVPVLSRMIPKFTIDPGLDMNSISRDHALVAQYTGDPLFSTQLTLKAASEIMRAVYSVTNTAERFPIPLLILHGSADEIVPPDSSETFIKRIRSTESKRIQYHEARHNLLIEINRTEIYNDILVWLREHNVG